MSQKFVFIVLLLFTIYSLTAAVQTAADFETSQLKLIERQREAIQNSRINFLRLPSSLPRSYEIEEAILQFTGWDRSETWQNHQKINYFYDGAGQIKEMIESYWDQFDNEWSSSLYKIEINRLDNGLIDTIILYLLVNNEIFLKSMEYVHTYNDRSQLEEVEMKNYDLSGQVATTNGYINFYYDDNHMVESMKTTDIYDESIRLEEIIQTTFTYDANGRIVEAKEQEFIDNQWEMIGKSEIEYHFSDDTTYQDVQSFVNNIGLYYTQSWYLESASFPMGNPELERWYEWYGNEWLLWEKYLYFYDDNNLLTRIEEHFYESYEEEWIIERRSLYSYNELSLLADLTHQWHDWEDPELWHGEGRVLFSYQNVTSKDQQLVPALTNNITNYPNPFNPETTIMFDLPADQQVDLKIYNLKGQLVSSLFEGNLKSGQQKITWNGMDDNGNSLSSGVYLYRLETEDGSHFSGRMMLLK